MRQVTEQNQPVIVERGGKPQVVILSVQQYERLKTDSSATEWKEMVAKARQQVQAELQGRPLPSVVDVLQQARQEQSEQLADLS